MLESIEAYIAFARLMERGNFSAVGRDMGISQSTVSKHIAGLEASLGMPLFVRTTRSINPTAEAAQLYSHVQRMLEALDDVRAFARGQRPEIAGLLRIAVPVSFGRMHIVPLLPAYMRLHPAVSVEVVLSDRVDDMIKEGLEIVVTTAEPRSGSLVSRSIRVYERVVVASGAYLAARGRPGEPVDLDGHDVIVATNTIDASLEFDSEHGRQAVRLRGRLCTNSDEVAYDAARAGRGIAVVPSWLAQADLASGAMTALLTDYFLPPIQVSLTYPSTRVLSRRARAFIDFLVAELARPTRARQPGGG